MYNRDEVVRKLKLAYVALDEAYGAMFSAFDHLDGVSSLSCNLEKSIENFDMSSISCIKGDVEELLEELENEV